MLNDTVEGESAENTGSDPNEDSGGCIRLARPLVGKVTAREPRGCSEIGLHSRLSVLIMLPEPDRGPELGARQDMRGKV